MMWRLRASRDDILLFMDIRIRSLPPRKPTDPTDLESTQYLSPFKLKTYPSNVKTVGHRNRDPHANPTCVSSTKMRVEL